MSDKKEYIEREALIGDFKSCGADQGLVDAIAYRINQHPAADVEVVRHGAWVEYWDDNYLSFCHKCSECKGLPLTKEETMHDEVLSAYCPHCGAKMDGKTDVTQMFMNCESLTSLNGESGAKMDGETK